MATGIGDNASGAPYPPGCRFDDASRRRVNAALHNASRASYDSSDHGLRGQKWWLARVWLGRNPVKTVTRTQSFAVNFDALHRAARCSELRCVLCATKNFFSLRTVKQLVSLPVPI
jgi:hypothetical protein